MEHHQKSLNLRWKWINRSNKNNSIRLKDICLIADRGHYWVYLFHFTIRLMKIQENKYFITNICFINIIVQLLVSVPFLYLKFLFSKKTNHYTTEMFMTRLKSSRFFSKVSPEEWSLCKITIQLLLILFLKYSHIFNLTSDLLINFWLSHCLINKKIYSWIKIQSFVKLDLL